MFFCKNGRNRQLNFQQMLKERYCLLLSRNYMPLLTKKSPSHFPLCKKLFQLFCGNCPFWTISFTMNQYASFRFYTANNWFKTKRLQPNIFRIHQFHLLSLRKKVWQQQLPLNKSCIYTRPICVLNKVISSSLMIKSDFLSV